MRNIILSVLVCALTAVAAPAQIIVAGGGAPIGIPEGASIWYGAAAPLNTVGANGDYYLNTSSYCLYGPKAAGVWSSTCVSSVRQLGYIAENIANKGTGGGYAPLDTNALVPAANLPAVTAINGTSIPTNDASDQTVVTTAPTVGAWTPLPACPDTGGNHLNYSLVTHGFLCGNTGGTAGSVGFGGVGAGTNANGLLVSGTLGYTGGGHINANQLGGVLLSGLPTGLLKITIGTGAPAAATSSDVTSALGFNPENTANKNAPNGYAPLDANGMVPPANLPPNAAINGTSIPVNSASDQTVVTTAPSVAAWAALPSCPDAGGYHLNYSTVAHGFLCGNTGGSAGSVSFGGVGPGINSNALLINGTLSYSGNGQVNANQLSGVSLAGLSTGILKITSGSGVPSVAASSDVTGTLGFTPENTANRNAANGYAPLDANGLLPAANLPAITAVNGTSVPSNNASDQTVVTTAASVGAWAALPSCPDSGGNHLNYSSITHGFLCGNTGGPAGSVQFNSVQAGTNSGALLVAGSLDYTGGGQINANLLSGVSLAGLSTGLLKNTSGTGAPSVATASDVTGTLGFTPENTANRNAANGYAPLDANGLLPAANLPAITTVNGTSVPSNSGSDQTVITTAASVGAWTALPACPDTGGNHLNYNSVTHGFLCGSTGGTVGSIQFNSVQAGTNSGALLVSGSLGYTGGGQINANQLSGVSLAGLPTGLLKVTTGTGAPSAATSSDVTNTLGFIPENSGNKGAPGGYAPLDASGLLPAANLPAGTLTATNLENATLPVNVISLATTSDITSGGALTATGNVYANSGSNVAGCLHLSDASGVHDMGICAPSSGFNGLFNLPPTAGTAGQAYTSDGAGGSVWSTSINGTQIPTRSTLLTSGGALGTPSSGVLSYATGLPWSALVSLPSLANSVFGRSGIVTAQSGDYTFSQIGGSLNNTQLPLSAMGTVTGGTWSAKLLSPTMGTGASSLSHTVTAGTGGVTANMLAAKDTSASTRYIVPPAGGCGAGVAASSASSGAQFELYSIPGTIVTGVADNAITAGDILVGGTTTPGAVADSGYTGRGSIPSTTCTVGVAQNSATAGGTVLFSYDGTGIYGTQVNFTQTMTGAVTRTLQSKVSDVVSVLDFGAIPDGFTDNAPAFAAAIAAACPSGVRGRAITVPGGNYAIYPPGMQMVNSEDCYLRGESMGFVLTPIGTFTTPVISFVNCELCGIANMWMQITAPSTAPVAIQAKNVYPFVGYGYDETRLALRDILINASANMITNGIALCTTSCTATAITGGSTDGAHATVNVASTAPGGLPQFWVGSNVNVTGASPSTGGTGTGVNVTNALITAVTPTSVSYANTTAAGAILAQGVIVVPGDDGNDDLSRFDNVNVTGASNDCFLFQGYNSQGHYVTDSGFLDCGRTVNITGGSTNGTTATVNVASSAGYLVGLPINVTGASPSGLNVSGTITATTPTSISYTNATASGTILAQGVIVVPGHGVEGAWGSFEWHGGYGGYSAVDFYITGGSGGAGNLPIIIDGFISENSNQFLLSNAGAASAAPTNIQITGLSWAGNETSLAGNFNVIDWRYPGALSIRHASFFSGADPAVPIAFNWTPRSIGYPTSKFNFENNQIWTSLAPGNLSTGPTYFSGASGCTNGTQAVTFSNYTSGVNATGTITVSGTMPSGAVTLVTYGSGYAVPPTQGTVATCTGTAVFTGGTVVGQNAIYSSDMPTVHHGNVAFSGYNGNPTKIELDNTLALTDYQPARISLESTQTTGESSYDLLGSDGNLAARFRYGNSADATDPNVVELQSLSASAPFNILMNGVKTVSFPAAGGLAIWNGSSDCGLSATSTGGLNLCSSANSINSSTQVFLAGTYFSGALNSTLGGAATMAIDNQGHAGAGMIGVQIGGGAITNTSGTAVAARIQATYNQTTGTPNGTDLVINRTETHILGTHKALSFQNNGTEYAEVDHKGFAQFPAQESVGAVPGIYGCSAGTQTGGATAGTFSSGTTGTCTVTLTFAFTAAHGWYCGANDLTTNTDMLRETSTTANSAVLSGTTVSGDVVNFACTGY